MLILQHEKISHEDIYEAMRRGISFIKKAQMPSGELPTRISSHDDMKDSQYIKTIAMALLVASSLVPVKILFDDANQIIGKCVEFILNEMEDDKKFKFFGKDSDIIPDLEDTTYALTLLLENGIDLDYDSLANEMLQYRTNEGIFYTWFKENDYKIDWVTNTNILYFYNNNMGIRVLEVEYYLKNVIHNKSFEDSSLYYKNPFSFIYFFTRLCSDDVMNVFKNEIPILIDFLLDKFSDNDGWSNPLNNILATTSLINCGYDGEILNRAVKMVIDEQEKDGGWQIGQIFNHRSINFAYGSRELSTSLAIEGLGKYSIRPLYK